MTDCSVSPCQVKLRHKSFGVHAMLGGGRSTTLNSPGETHQDCNSFPQIRLICGGQ